MAVVSRQPIDRREAPVVNTVFLTDEGLRHSRCGAVLSFVRRRQALELIFHCRACHEHITLTEYALTRVPVGAPRGVAFVPGPDEPPAADDRDDEEA
jgi:hypothetical protein